MAKKMPGWLLPVGVGVMGGVVLFLMKGKKSSGETAILDPWANYDLRNLPIQPGPGTPGTPNPPGNQKPREPIIIEPPPAPPDFDGVAPIAPWPPMPGPIHPRNPPIISPPELGAAGPINKTGGLNPLEMVFTPTIEKRIAFYNPKFCLKHR